MRMSIDYVMSGEWLPKDYRSGFMSLIKKAIQEADPRLFDCYYNQRMLKPFTFSTFFPYMNGTYDGRFNVGNEVRINYSTSSLELATHLYNGFYKVRNFQLFENALTQKRITMRRFDEIRSKEVVFKTASPVLVNNIGKSDWYLLPGEEGFLDGLRFAVGEIAKAFLGKTGSVDIEFVPIQIKRKVVRHYNMDMSSLVGLFKLKSEPEILQLIYDVGLGVRRSQGFGMLEVVKQECNNGKQ